MHNYEEEIVEPTNAEFSVVDNNSHDGVGAEEEFEESQEAETSIKASVKSNNRLAEDLEHSP